MAILGRSSFLSAPMMPHGKSAAIYSLLRTAAQHGVPPLPYLTHVLHALADRRMNDGLDEFLPDRWIPSSAASSRS